MKKKSETEPESCSEPVRRKAKPVLRIDVWSDIACPWCWIGKRKLEAALTEFAHGEDVEVVWRAFELDPSAPRTLDNPGRSYAERLARKYGTSVEEGQKMIDRMTRVGTDNGVRMRFDRIHPGNTFDAHRLLHLARKKGLQEPLKERFFKAYLQDGEPIGEREALIRVASEVGIDANQAEAVLIGNDFKVQVRQDETKATALGIMGVPFFLFGKQYGISGAQPAEVLLQLLHKTWGEMLQEMKTVREGVKCGPTGCT